MLPIRKLEVKIRAYSDINIRAEECGFSLKLAPNPVHSELVAYYKVPKSGYLIRIVDPNTFISYVEYKLDGAESKVSVNVQSLAPGIYMVLLLKENNEIVLAEKFMKD